MLANASKAWKIWIATKWTFELTPFLHEQVQLC